MIGNSIPKSYIINDNRFKILISSKILDIKLTINEIVQNKWNKNYPRIMVGTGFMVDSNNAIITSNVYSFVSRNSSIEYIDIYSDDSTITNNLSQNLNIDSGKSPCAVIML